MNKLYNLARVTTTTTGTGTITLGSAVSGFLTFAQAGVADGDIVTYAISDGVNCEIGQGTYTSSGTTLTRTTVYRSSGAANVGKITLSGSAQVFITAAAEDFQTTPNPPAHIDLDFANNRYWNAPHNPVNPFTCTRASVGYIDDTAGKWTEVAANTIRRSDKGILIEEARTNSFRNSALQGAAEGSPGTLPTNMNITGATGLTRTIIVTTDPADNIPYVEINYSGTATSTAQFIINLETNTGIPAVNGQTWAHSLFFENSSTTGLTAVTLQCQQLDGSGVNLNNNNVVAGLIGDTWARVGGNFTTNNASVGFIRPRITTNSVASGTVCNFTIRFGFVQTELLADNNSTYSSPIRTTGSAATRAADVVDLYLPPEIGTAQTIAAKGTPNQPITYASAQAIATVSDGTSSNRWGILRRVTTGLPGTLLDNAQVAIGSAAWAQNTSGIVVAANAVGSQSSSFNGSAITTGADATSLTGMTKVSIGHRGDDVAQWNGYIERIMIWPQTRLGNSVVVDAATVLPPAGYVIDVGHSSTNEVGLIPSSTTNAGWAVSSNYQGYGEVNYWNTVESTGVTNNGFYWHQKTNTTPVLLAAIYGDSTYVELDVIGGGQLAYLGVDPNPVTGAFFGTGTAIPMSVWTNNIERASFPSTGGMSILGGINRQSTNIHHLTELTTIAAAASTTTTIQIPADALVVGVSVRVTTVIPTAANFSVGVSGATARYGTGISTAATTTSPGTLAGILYYAAATGIVITPNLTPANNTGRVRVTIHYISITPPTS